MLLFLVSLEVNAKMEDVFLFIQHASNLLTVHRMRLVLQIDVVIDVHSSDVLMGLFASLVNVFLHAARFSVLLVQLAVKVDVLTTPHTAELILTALLGMCV